MNKQIYFDELAKLESGFPGLRTLSDVECRMRHQAIWEVVKEFTEEEFCKASLALRKSRESFPPSVTEIYQACLDASDDKPRPARARRLKAHKCATGAPDANPGPLIIFPYEAKHIMCPGKIAATCPECGTRHYNTEILEKLSNELPKEQTEGWNKYWKGYLLCPRCSAGKP